MGREYELKYRADEKALSAIRTFFGGFEAISMETTYYDTPEGHFSRLRWTLRRRLENGRSICTLKVPLADGSRGEWEVPSPDIASALPALLALGAPEQLKKLSDNGLVVTCGARFTRFAKSLTLDRCTVELALDSGLLLGGGKELPLSELEVELKAGEESAAAAFADSLAQAYHLIPEPKSKVQRALELTQN